MIALLAACQSGDHLTTGDALGLFAFVGILWVVFR